MADARASRLPTHKRSDTSTPWGTQSRAKPLTECRHVDKTMSLLDIDDFSMRSKVAQLMAVAPALAVMDLYHLIIDSEGDLLSLHVWRKTLRDGMSVMLLTTTKSNTVERRRESRNRDTSYSAFTALRIVSNKSLRG
ncbi:hypothetical protein IG631_13932 [Alternaria alternata]|nr:hypothetical protein IG631_13932 [Alternaria alternata]